MAPYSPTNTSWRERQGLLQQRCRGRPARLAALPVGSPPTLSPWSRAGTPRRIPLPGRDYREQRRQGGKRPGRPFALAIYVRLAPEERNAGTPPQGDNSAQPDHRSHLLHSNQILFYAISIALVGIGHLGQMSDFLAAVVEEAGTPRRVPRPFLPPLLLAPLSRLTWKTNAANFACTEFSEVPKCRLTLRRVSATPQRR